MTPVIRFLDRAATLVAGLVLLGVGAAAFVWDRGLGVNWPDHPDADRVLTFLRSDWVPWVAGLGGVVVVLISLGWLAGHANRRRVRTLELERAQDTGMPAADAAAVAPVVDVGAIASAAATELARRPDVVTCRGKAIRDRRQLVVELRPTLSAQADLAAVTAAAEHAADSVHSALGRDDVHVRVAARVKR